MGIDDGVDKYNKSGWQKRQWDKNLSDALERRRERTVRVKIRQSLNPRETTPEASQDTLEGLQFLLAKAFPFDWEHPWRRSIVKLSLDHSWRHKLCGYQHDPRSEIGQRSEITGA
jgi:hypothetical protein